MKPLYDYHTTHRRALIRALSRARLRGDWNAYERIAKALRG